MRLVDTEAHREDFIDTVYRELEEDPTNQRANRIIDAYDSAPIVEIVMCGECQFFMEYSPTHVPPVKGAEGDCRLKVLRCLHPADMTVRKCDFCSWGKRGS